MYFAQGQVVQLRIELAELFLLNQTGRTVLSVTLKLHPDLFAQHTHTWKIRAPFPETKIITVLAKINAQQVREKKRPFLFHLVVEDEDGNRLVDANDDEGVRVYDTAK